MQPERLAPPPAPTGGNERIAPVPGQEFRGTVQSGQTPEAQPGLQPVHSPEQQPNAERHEQQTGQHIQQAGAPVTAPPAIAPPPVVDDAAPVAVIPPRPGTSGLAAADADVIEKEWVDKVKAIIKETSNDPYLKEQQVSRLQADYLERRFGVQVKLPQD